MILKTREGYREDKKDLACMKMCENPCSRTYSASQLCVDMTFLFLSQLMPVQTLSSLHLVVGNPVSGSCRVHRQDTKRALSVQLDRTGRLESLKIQSFIFVSFPFPARITPVTAPQRYLLLLLILLILNIKIKYKILIFQQSHISAHHQSLFVLSTFQQYRGAVPVLKSL